jgi:hypothetical protein
VTPDQDRIIVHKNRKRAFWSLAIVLFMVPVSAVLLLLGLQPGRPDVAWALVLFGALGILAFAFGAFRIVRTMRSPWHLELGPGHLTLRAPTYDLRLPWDSIAGIGVNEVNRKPGCVLVLEDPAAVARGAAFYPGGSNRRSAVTDAATMQARMEQSFQDNGYHLAIPGRLLEMGPEELAGMLARARQGELWPQQEELA